MNNIEQNKVDCRIMTAEEAINYSVNETPNIYSAPTIEDIRLKFFNITFNSSHSLIRDYDDLFINFNINKYTVTKCKKINKKYINSKLYQLINYSGLDGLKLLNKNELYTKDELDASHYDSYDVEPIELSHFKLNDFNNLCFISKMGMEIELLDKSWIILALEFYNYIKNNLSNINIIHLNYIINKDDNDSMIESNNLWWHSHLLKNFNFDIKNDESKKSIEMKFGIDFNGNIKEFVKNYNKSKLDEIEYEVNMTIEYLNDILENKE